MGHGPYPLALLQQVFVLAICVRSRAQKEEVDELQRQELNSLIESADWTVCQQLEFTLKKVHPSHLLGSGQITKIAENILRVEEEIYEYHDLADALDFVVIDYELSPAQLFHLEKIFKKQVVDRKALILTLFEQRAQTKEGRLQVHLARLYYEKPRLKRAWGHLSRQRGGRYGTRGEGETQIEIDARLINEQIRKLEAQISLAQKRRNQQRKKGANLPHVALVGYTNSGKSALMQALSQKEIYVADRLFATLDPKSSELTLPSGEQVIVTDTVGFVRNLPHELIDAFRATLEETILADLQVLVLDTSDIEWQEKLATVHEVLQELEVDKKAQILVLNKIDLLTEAHRQNMQALFPNALLVSAHNKLGLEFLYQVLSERLAEFGEGLAESYALDVPHEAGALRAWLFAQKLVESEQEMTDKSQVFYLRLTAPNLHRLRQRFPQFLGCLTELEV